MRGSVVHAGGAGMGGQCGAALAQGVKIMACENTMTNTKVTRDDMLPNISCIKARVVELMLKQQQRRAYIRPWQLVQRVSSLPRRRESRKATH